MEAYIELVDALRAGYGFDAAGNFNEIPESEMPDTDGAVEVKE